MKQTNIEAIRGVDWTRMENEVVEKIHALRQIAEGLKSSPLNDKIAHDLLLPALVLLGQFCSSVKIEEEE